MAKTNQQRTRALRVRRAALGLVRREYYATLTEHEGLRFHLKKMRGENVTENTVQTDGETSGEAN